MPDRIFFAWVNSNETTFLPQHARWDEDVFSFTVVHQEGEFPGLELEIKNPRVGLLSPGRKVWAWLAWDRSAPNAPADIVPLFFGRLVGLPQEMQGEILKLSFIARPLDYEAQKTVLSESLKVAPYWDPIFLTVEQRHVPDSVLEARTQRWHIDRVTHVVSVSDIVTGEDGTLEYSNSGRELFYDNLNLAFNDTPLRRVSVEAELSWKQSAAGGFNITPALINAFIAVGGGESYIISSYTGEGLIDEWPKQASRIGSGWSIGAASAARFDTPWGAKFFVGDATNAITYQIGTDAIAVRLRPLLGTFVGQDNSRILTIPIWRVAPTLNVEFNVTRSRREIVRFDLISDTQPILTEPADAEVVKLTANSHDVGSDIGFGPSAIGDIRRAYYLPTARGRQSLEYLICLARARMLARARAAQLQFDTAFIDAIDLSLRKNALVIDPRLPGGQGAGKIIQYEFSLDGRTGRMSAKVTAACCIGRGGTVTASPGTPTYVVVGYVEEGYQFYESSLIMPFAGEITYADFTSPDIDDYDGVDFFDMRAGTTIQALTVSNGPATQRAAVEAHQGEWQDPAEAFEALNAIPTRVHLDMKPLEGGPFTAEYDIILSELQIPKTIDLEA